MRYFVILLLLMAPQFISAATIIDYNFNTQSWGILSRDGDWSFDPTGGMSGTPAAKLYVDSSGVQGYTMSLNTSAYNSSEYWVEFDIKVAGNLSGGNKFVKFFGSNTESTQNNMSFWVSASGVQQEVGYYGDANCTSRWSGSDVGSATGRDCTANHITSTSSIDFRDGAWHRYKLWVKRASTGVKNGEVKVWYDGVLRAHIAGMNSNPPGTISTKFERIHFGDYVGATYNSPWSMWIDNLYVGTTEKGSPEPIPGFCGANNGATFTSLTASDPNNCSEGAVGTFGVTENSATWQCLGQYGGPPANCSAAISPDTCTDNAALCNMDDCASYYPTYSYCLNDAVKCHPGGCLSVGSLTNFNLLSQEECTAEELFFWGGTCNTVAEPTNLTTANLIVNSNLLDWTSVLPTGFTSYIPGNIEKTFLGARMFNGATLNPSYSLKIDTIYTAVYNLMTVQGFGKIWSEGFPEDHLWAVPGTIIHQFTTPSVMLDRKLYIGSGSESNVEANNFRLYESTKETVVIPPGVPSQRYKVGGVFVKEVTNN